MDTVLFFEPATLMRSPGGHTMKHSLFACLILSMFGHGLALPQSAWEEIYNRPELTPLEYDKTDLDQWEALYNHQE